MKSFHLPDMHAKGAMDARTIETDKNAIRHTCPLWIGCIAVETGAIAALTLQFIELLFVFGHNYKYLLTPEVYFVHSLLSPIAVPFCVLSPQDINGLRSYPGNVNV